MTHTIHSVTQRQVHGDSETHTRDWVTRYCTGRRNISHGRLCIDHAHIGNTYKPAAALPRAKIVLLTSTLFLIQTARHSGLAVSNPGYVVFIGASLSEPHMGSKSVPRELSIYVPMCSAQTGNLRKPRIALRKLGIPTLPRKAGIAPPHRRLSAISSATRRVRWLP